MFTAQAIASVCLSIGTMEFIGESTRQLSKLPDFSAKLGRPYQTQTANYRFQLQLNKGVCVDELDVAAVKAEMIDAFIDLLNAPAVIARYGRLTFVGSTTKGSIRQKLAAMVFGDKAATDPRGATKKVHRTNVLANAHSLHP